MQLNLLGVDVFCRGVPCCGPNIPWLTTFRDAEGSLGREGTKKSRLKLKRGGLGGLRRGFRRISRLKYL